MRKNVLGLMHRGQISKAANRIVSHGIANHAELHVQEQLRAKFPPRKKLLPRAVTKMSPMDQFKNLRGTLLSLSLAVAPGSGGLRNEFLVALGERMDNDEMKQLERLGMAYVRAELPSWFYKVWLSLQTVALYKSADKADVRPLGLRNSPVSVP